MMSARVTGTREAEINQFNALHFMKLNEMKSELMIEASVTGAARLSSSMN